MRMPTEDEKLDFFSKQTWEEDRSAEPPIKSPKKSGEEEIKPADEEGEEKKEGEGLNTILIRFFLLIIKLLK